MKKNEYIGKSLEELKEKALKELNINETEAYFFQEEEEGGFLKGKKVKLIVLIKYEIVEYCKNFIKEIIGKMGIEVNLEAKVREDCITINLISDNNSILIGRNGKTIDSLQLLLRSSIQNKTGYKINILLDVGSYKEQKTSNLEYRIKKLALDVKRTGAEIKLDPMNSYERRVVHNICNEFDGIITESIGEEPNRYIIIKLEK
ncbi:MAG: KH domain-containing protein [Bacilli bacterium]|nr:KH domain-containing protein [Bacilli bacterium]